MYAQVTQLFLSAPDLLEDFKQFLPESAAHGKAQASRAMAQEEQANNARSDASYAAGTLPQAQTPRPTSKMPPMGQFDPPSTSKDTKKRRGGPGATLTNQASTQSTADTGLQQGGRSGLVQVGNANKVRTKIVPAVLTSRLDTLPPLHCLYIPTRPHALQLLHVRDPHMYSCSDMLLCLSHG